MQLIFWKAKALKDDKALAYVQWFTNPTGSQQGDASQLLKVEYKFNAEGKRVGEVNDMTNVIQSCPLLLRYGKKADDLVPGANADGSNCLEECN